MKKIIVLVLIAALAAPMFIIGVSAFALKNSTNPFEYIDKARTQMLNGVSYTKPLPMPNGGNGERYIVAFEKTVSLFEVFDALGDREYSLPAYSSERMFVVSLGKDDDFAYKNREIIRYMLPDTELREAFEEDVTADEVLPEYTAIGADSAYDGKNIVIAVLDSGVNRSHEELAEANILQGYDASADLMGVDSDSSGHGTSVIGIIVSKTYGIAKGATILPVRIIGSGKRVLTSDLVRGIYYAADSGADIINMSFGGYDENKAESDAVAYAREKGCIMVSSAGNEGYDGEYAGKYSYPASYDGVICVASCDNKGNASLFSQYNDRVDIAAPGESITLIGFDGKESVVRKANGTSYSCAFVSAAAAIAKQNSLRKMNTDYFGKILEYASKTEKNDYTGYGIINIPDIIENLSKPFVSGVSDGKAYFEEVSAVFENAVAFLDGEEYFSGEGIFSQGNHILSVSDEFGEVVFNIAVDLTELTYNIERGDGWVAVTFDRGTATVDGTPYASGTRITGYGRNDFVLTGPYGNTATEALIITDTLPTVIGVEDESVYGNRIAIDIIGTGRAYIDGNEFVGRAFASEGTHTLLVTDISGNKRKTYSFTVDGSSITKIPLLPSENCVFGSDYGWTGCYDIGREGISFYTESDFNTIAKYISTSGGVLHACIQNGKLYVFSENAVSIYSCEDILSVKNPLIESHASESRIVNGTVCGGEAVYFDETGSIYRINGGIRVYTAKIEADSSDVFMESNGKSVFIYASLNPTKLVKITGSSVYMYSLPSVPLGEGLNAWDEYVSIGSQLLSENAEKTVLGFPEAESLLYYGRNRIITRNSVYSSDGILLGKYEKPLYSVYEEKEGLILVYQDKTIEKVSTNDDFLGSYEVKSSLTGKEHYSKPYEYYTPLINGTEVRDCIFSKDDGGIYVILRNDNRLFKLSEADGSVEKCIHLRYTPLSLKTLGNGIAVIFERSCFVYDVSNDQYLDFGMRVSSVCSDNGRIFAVVNNMLCEYIDGKAEYTFGEMEANGVSAQNGRLYISTVFDLTCFDVESKEILFVHPLAFRGNAILTDKYVIAGRFVYDINDFSSACILPYDAVACSGDTVITSNGLYSTDGSLISHTDYYTENIVFTPEFSAFVFLSDSLSVVKSPKDPTVKPVIKGVENGKVYYDMADIYVDCGDVFVDGVKVPNDHSVTDFGHHTLTVLMPWDVLYKVDFSVKYTPRAVQIKNPLINLNVGQKASIKASILPIGAEGELIYAVSSGDIAISQNGQVTASSQGECTVAVGIKGTAVVSYCKIHVTDANIICKEPSYVIDRSIETLSGIMPGTRISDFVSAFDAFNSYYAIRNKDGGNVVDGIVATGMTLSKYTADGGETDSLTLCVKGDLDGDGMITVNDGDILYRHLKSASPLDDLQFISSDMNGNGRLTIVDLKELRKLIDGSFGNITANGSLYINVPLFVYEDADFYLTLRDDRLESASSLSGELVFDPAKLEVTEISSFGSEFNSSVSDGRVYYSAFGINDAESRVLRVFFKSKIGVTGTTRLSFEKTRLSSNGLKTAENQSVELDIRNGPAEKLEITSTNGNFVFDSGVYRYDVTIPREDEYIDMVFSCPKDCFVYFDNANLFETHSRELTVSYLTPSGITEYVFNVIRGDTYVSESNSLLRSLNVANKLLEPAFDCNVHTYTVSVEKNTLLEIAPIPQSEKATFEIKAEFGTDNDVYTIICTAEDGSKTVYTIYAEHIFYPDTSSEISEEESEEESYVSSEESERSVESSIEESEEGSKPQSVIYKKSNTKAVIMIIVSALLVTFAVVAVIFRRKTQ